MSQLNSRYLTCAALGVILFGAGCQTHEKQTAVLTEHKNQGNLMGLISETNKRADEQAGKRDEVVWRLEQGATLRVAALADASKVPPIVDPKKQPKLAEGQTPPPPPTAAEVRNHYYKASQTAFDQAEERIAKYEEEAKTKVSQEIVAALTNLASIPYKGRYYDKVMMNTYKAINYLEMGAPDKARVELIRAYQRQDDAKEEAEKRTQEVIAEAEKAKKGEVKDEKGKSAAYDTEKALADAKTGPAIKNALEESTPKAIPLYPDYQNPFTMFLYGLFWLHQGVEGGEVERARKAFESLLALFPEHEYVKADLAAATKRTEGQVSGDLTYVILETGTSPARTETRIDIPTFLVTSKLAYVGAAFPKLVFNNNYLKELPIQAGELTIKPVLIGSMDSIIATEYKNEWPAIVTKTLISTATKAIIQAAVQKQLEDSGGKAAGFLGGLALGAANQALTIADTRTWLALPKEFQYARFETPKDGTIVLSIGEEKLPVKLPEGSVKVVYVKVGTKVSDSYVSTFALRL
jgi:hypothetical protein